MSLVDAIIQSNLSESSKTQYLEKLVTLKKLVGKPLEYIIDHPRQIVDVLRRQYPCPLTQRAFVAAIKAVFHYNDLKTHKARQYEQYTAFQTEMSQAVTNRYMAAEPSDRERKNWVPWPDVLAKERELAATQYGSDDHLLLAMYCLIEPLRQDFGAVRILVDRHPPDGAKGNYLAIARDGSWGDLVLNRYKTARKYGTYTRDLPVQLLDIVKASLIARPRAYLFVNETGNPYKLSNSFTKMSNRTLQRIFGKNFTVSLMRHSHISNIDFNASTPGQLFEKSKNMAHSISMQQLYRRKVEPMPDLVVEKLPDTHEAAHAPPPSGPEPGVSLAADGMRYITLTM